MSTNNSSTAAPTLDEVEVARIHRILSRQARERWEARKHGATLRHMETLRVRHYAELDTLTPNGKGGK